MDTASPPEPEVTLPCYCVVIKMYCLDIECLVFLSEERVQELTAQIGSDFNLDGCGTSQCQCGVITIVSVSKCAWEPEEEVNGELIERFVKIPESESEAEEAVDETLIYQVAKRRLEATLFMIAKRRSMAEGTLTLESAGQQSFGDLRPRIEGRARKRPPPRASPWTCDPEDLRYFPG